MYIHTMNLAGVLVPTWSSNSHTNKKAGLDRNERTPGRTSWKKVNGSVKVPKADHKNADLQQLPVQRWRWKTFGEIWVERCVEAGQGHSWTVAPVGRNILNTEEGLEYCVSLKLGKRETTCVTNKNISLLKKSGFWGQVNYIVSNKHIRVRIY